MNTKTPAASYFEPLRRALNLISARREAYEAAKDIRQWTDGPNPPPWRIERLAKAILAAEQTHKATK